MIGGVTLEQMLTNDCVLQMLAELLCQLRCSYIPCINTLAVILRIIQGVTSLHIRHSSSFFYYSGVKKMVIYNNRNGMS